MKIEIDLTKVDDHPSQARTLAVTLLNSLTLGEAELAVTQWRMLSATGIHTPPANDANPAPAVVEPVAEAAPEPVEPVAAAEPEAAEEALFSYRGKKPSPNKKGPQAVLSRACEDITFCKSVAELEALRPDVNGLRDWFNAIGQQERAKTLINFLSRKSGELVNAEGLGDESTATEPDLLNDTTAQQAQEPAAPASVPAKPLRELLREAEHELGRPKVVALLKEHGATTLADLTTEAEANLRASIQGQMAA